jgi:hypothetical protein
MSASPDTGRSSASFGDVVTICQWPATSGIFYLVRGYLRF